MVENIIYEDTPFAEYLAEIGREEELVKQPEPIEMIREDSQDNKVTVSLFQKFKYDLTEYLRENLSTGLPLQEENDFEELFKYLLCTSHLLNDTLSIYFYNAKRPPLLEIRDFELYCCGFSKNSFEIIFSSIIGLMSILTTWLLLFNVNQEDFITKMIQLSIPFALISFVSYRYLRRKTMRTLHKLALYYIEVLVYHCQALDLKINKVLIMIQEIELISRGYRLSMPLSPISRIEQHSKNRRCLALRETLYNILKEALDKTDRLSLENLKQCFQKMHSKRRECLCHLLALDVMTTGRDSNRRDYEGHWVTVNTYLNNLGTVIEHYMNKITLASTNEQSSPKQDMPQPSPTIINNKKLKSYIQRLASVEQHIRAVQAKLYICNEDACTAKEDEKNKLLNNYESINKDFTYMFQEWEEGMKALKEVIGLTPSDADSSSNQLSLDEDAETLRDETDHEENYIKHNVDWSQIDGPFDVPEQVFIAEAEPEVSSKKMTREERIMIQKAKREDEAKAKAARVDSELMVHELKDVLIRRKPKSSKDEFHETPAVVTAN
ncbi:3342_t:CDS:2 [Entrophospora sp. SA101]|nr:14615_t:CDS:2 [Entrophospora sp. SA101]CAJ0760811.1 3342_t:CDS:2 [Entrophospora sp. SA101]CAJ0845970.1 10761_t:CDS:2 [Entrophospora sp. SA101]CAJ0880124.1 10991_t:CDS:2 [Entrophospora sp. SA101]